MRKFWSLLPQRGCGLACGSAGERHAAPKQHHSADGRSDLFDGAWSVVIDTSSGSCSSYRVAVRIVGGRVEGGDGTIQLKVRSVGAEEPLYGEQLSGSAVGYGRLHGSSGGGWWRTSGGECAGSWSASRHGEQPRSFSGAASSASRVYLY